MNQWSHLFPPSEKLWTSTDLKNLRCDLLFNHREFGGFIFTAVSLNKWGPNNSSVYFLCAGGSGNGALWQAQSNSSLSHPERAANPALLGLFMNKAMCYLGLSDKLILRTRGIWNILDLVLSKEDLTTKFEVVKISQKPLIEEQIFPRQKGHNKSQLRLQNAGGKEQSPPDWEGLFFIKIIK